MAAPRKSSSKSSGRPDPRQALLEAYQDVVRTAGQKPTPAPPDPPSRLPFWIGSLTLIVALSLIGIWQPSWLFTPQAKESPALVEASLRVRIYSEIQRIERFQAVNHHLPATLAEALGDSTGVVYQPTGEQYTLTGRNGALTIVYKSETPAKQFVGNSYAIIRAR